MPPKRKSATTKPAKRNKVEKVEVERQRKRGKLAVPGYLDSTTEESESSSGEDAGKGKGGKGGGVEEEEEEEEEWEDVLPASTAAAASLIPADKGEDLELTLSRAPAAEGALDGKKKGASVEQRRIRVLTHCMHVQFLLFHGWVRNRWVCDAEVQAVLLSLLPAGVAKAFERARGGKGKADPLLQPLGMLLHWWRGRFSVTAPALRKRGYRSLRQFVDEREAAGGDVLAVLTGRRDMEGKEVVTMVKREGETVEGLDEFRALARECRGSRDVGALLLTGICRALGYEARMVFSLQPLGFGFSTGETAEVVTGGGAPVKVNGNATPEGKGKAKAKEKGRGKRKRIDSEEDDDESSELSSLEDTSSDDDGGKSSKCKPPPRYLQTKSDIPCSTRL